MAQHRGYGLPPQRGKLQPLPGFHAAERGDGRGRFGFEPFRAPDGRSGRGGAVSDGLRAVGQEREEDVHVRLRHTEKPLRRRRERKFELLRLECPLSAKPFGQFLSVGKAKMGNLQKFLCAVMPTANWIACIPLTRAQTRRVGVNHLRWPRRLLK